ncbi:MAG: hypothetical protein U9O94_00400, partial [Nanoarchaeota archaeon]|nr:hypothetical protein [Nanoarchaeota archaeon]
LVNCTDSTSIIITSEKTIYVDTVNPFANFVNPANDNSTVQSFVNKTFELDVRVANTNLSLVNLEIFNSTNATLHTNVSGSLGGISTYDMIYGVDITGWAVGNYTVKVNATDMAGNNLSGAKSFRINAIPTVADVSINSSDNLNRTNGTLTGDYTYSDSDNDAESSKQTRWYNNTKYVQALDDLTSVNPSNTSTGDIWLFSVRVYDGYDYSTWVNSTNLTIVNTPPTTPTIIYPVNSSTYADIPYINYSSSDIDNDDLTYSIYINGTLNVTITNVNLTDWNASDGYYNLTISVSDGTSTSANSTSTFFTLDSAIPTVTIIHPINGSIISSNSVHLNISGSETGLTYYYYINGTLNSTTIDSNSSMNASDGDYNLTVIASDGAQNGSDTVYFTLDTTAPSFSNNWTNASLMFRNGNATFNITISDNFGLSYYIFSWNGTGTWDNLTNGTLSTTSSTVSISKSTTLPQGNTIAYRWFANDSADNWNESLLRTFTVVNTAPTTPTIIYPTSGNNYSNIPYINYSSTDLDDDTITYKIYINGTLNITTTTNVTDWNASDGYYNLTVSASDGTGSSSNSSEVYFTLDTTAPSFSNNWSNASSMKSNGNATFNITITDNFALNYYIFSWNGTGTWDNSTNGTLSGTSSTLSISKSSSLGRDNVIGYLWYANDSAGNLNKSIIRTFTIANNIPTTPTIIYPVSGNNYTNIPYINFTSTDADGDTITYKIYINGTLNMTTTTNVTDWNASDGYYNLTVSASDGTGSSSNSSSIEFLFSTAAPTFGGNKTNASETTPKYLDVVQINITLTTGGAQLDGYFFAHNDSGTMTNSTYRDISGSTYTIVENITISNLKRSNILGWQVWANNTVSNIGVSSTYTLEIKDTTPKINLVSPANGSEAITTQQTFTCNITDVDNDQITNLTLYVWNSSNVNVLTNKTNLSGSSNKTSWNYTLPASGTYTWNCLGYISDGISAWAPQNYTIEWDTTPPTIVSTSPTENVTSPTISLQATTDENAVCRYVSSTEGNMSTPYSNMTYSFDGNQTLHNETISVSTGYYEFYARCNDTSGNVMATSTNISFNVNIEIIIITTSGASGGGGGGGGTTVELNTTRQAILELEAPPTATIFSGESIDILVNLRNIGEVDFYSIDLKAGSNAPNMTLDLSDDSIDMLGISQQDQVALHIQSLTDTEAKIGLNRYIITLNVSAARPKYETNIKFFLDAKEWDYEKRSETTSQIEFAQDLFKENAECLEFNEILDQAESAYVISDYDTAISLIDSAIEACKDLLADEPAQPEDQLSPKRKSDLTLFMIEMIALVVLLISMLAYYFKRKGKGPKKLTQKSNLESEFEHVLKETNQQIRHRKLEKARNGYLTLHSLYHTIRSSSLSTVIKAQYAKELSQIYSKLSQLIQRTKK